MHNPDSVSKINPKTVVEKCYDLIAPKYLQWSAPRPTTARMAYISRLLTILPVGSRILELGCGAGIPCTKKLVEAGMNVVGVDISGKQIELAKRECGAIGSEGEENSSSEQGRGRGRRKATFIQSDMMSLEFGPEMKFDAVLAFYSLFHLPCDEQEVMIRKMASWLQCPPAPPKQLPNSEFESGEHNISLGGILLFNLSGQEDGGEYWRDDWMAPGARICSFGLGLEKYKKVVKEVAELEGLVVEDVVDIELVGGFEEKFYWVWARKA